MRRRFQEIPSNWFPEITLCAEQIMEIRSGGRIKGPCVRKYLRNAQVRTGHPVLIRVTDATTGRGKKKICILKRFVFFHAHNEEIAASSFEPGGA